jgi:hypothetical protein
MLLLRITEQETELHAFTGQFTIGQRPHAGQDRRQAAGHSAVRNSQPGRAADLPVGGHLFKIRDQQVARSGEIIPAAVAIAIGAGIQAVVARRAGAGTRTVAVEVLAPEHEFDRMVAGSDIGLDAARFLQCFGDKPGGNHAGIDSPSVDLDLMGWRPHSR